MSHLALTQEDVSFQNKENMHFQIIFRLGYHVPITQTERISENGFFVFFAVVCSLADDRLD